MKKNLISFENYLLMNEAETGSAPTKPAKISWTPGQTIKLQGQLFKLGKSDINKDSEEFRKALTALKGFKDEPITIIGGASAVGNDKGFDNKGLAKRRAEKFIQALKEEGINVSNYKVETVVGKATVANSPEANNEQFVGMKREIPSSSEQVSAIDNATVATPLIPEDQKVVRLGDADLVGMDVKILKVYYPLGKSKETLDKLAEAAKQAGAKLFDVTVGYNKKKYNL